MAGAVEMESSFLIWSSRCASSLAFIFFRPRSCFLRSCLRRPENRPPSSTRLCPENESAERIVYLEQRLGMPKEKVAARYEIRIKMLHHAALRSYVK